MMKAQHAPTPVSVGVGTDDRRASERVPGPFDAWRVGVLETPVRIYDISLGGCFVHAMHEQDPGVVVMLKIQLPGADCIEAKAETLYRRPGFGFGVKFVDLSDEMRARLVRALAIDRLSL
jgi:hypothetical protein